MYHNEEIKVNVMGVEISTTELLEDVFAAKKNGLSRQFAFSPETVEALLNVIGDMRKDRDVSCESLRGNTLTPNHPMVKSWAFEGGTDFEEAKLANAMAVLAEKSGMNANDLSKLFPAVLRMLKVKSPWTE